MNEAEYLMKNYIWRSRRVSRSRRIKPAEISIILHNYDTKAELNKCLIIHSK